MTGLWAFETQLPYQKYQGPSIVVRCMTSTAATDTKYNSMHNGVKY
jgi:hypothetical protein